MPVKRFRATLNSVSCIKKELMIQPQNFDFKNEVSTLPIID